MAQESHVRGDGSASLIKDTIGAYLDGVAEREGARLALVVPHQGVRWTYSELKARSDEFAAGLLGLGLRPARLSHRRGHGVGGGRRHPRGDHPRAPRQDHRLPVRRIRALASGQGHERLSRDYPS